MNEYELISDLKEHLDTYSQTFEDYNMTYNQVEIICYHIKKLRQENQQLQIQISAREEEHRKLEDNWNELKEWIDNEIEKEELEKENEELKKQLEDMTDCRDIASGHRKEVQDRETRLLNQQKEFIKYLEDKIKYFKDLEQFAIKTFNNKAVINLDLVKISMDEDRIVIDNLEEILQKYKEIIGVSDEH